MAQSAVPILVGPMTGKEVIQVDFPGQTALTGSVVTFATGAVLGAIPAASYTLVTPVTAFSLTVGAGVGTLLLTPAGTLATGTVTLPASPFDGQTCRIVSTQIVTALTLQGSGADTVTGAVTALAATGATASGAVAYMYNLSGTTWYRV